jgi:glycosyltransferase involved in cell wall biosynthesis
MDLGWNVKLQIMKASDIVWSTARPQEERHGLSDRSEVLPEVLILGNVLFPEGNGVSNNIRGHCRAIEKAGFSVGVLAAQAEGRPQDRLSSGGFAFSSIRYWPVRPLAVETLAHKFMNAFTAWDDDCLNWLFNQGPLAGVKAIITCLRPSRTVPLLLRLRRICRRGGIGLFNWVTEWEESWRYRPWCYGNPKFCLSEIDLELQMRVVNRGLDGIICISEFLRDYYSARGCRTILIPPLIDPAESKWATARGTLSQSFDKEIRILMAGPPDRERHDVIGEGVLRARRRGAPVFLEYLGSTRDQIASISRVGDALLRELGPAVRFHGRLPYDQVPSVVASASFGLLMRENARWSRACFPSRSVEFLAMGVPLLCNLTSDLAKYLEDGRNALIVKAVTAEALAETLLCAANLSPEQLAKMKTEARASSARFDAANYAGEYRRLISGEARICPLPSELDTLGNIHFARTAQNFLPFAQGHALEKTQRSPTEPESRH